MTPSRWPNWANAAILLAASFVTIAALSLRVSPGTDVVAVSFPPWWSAERSLAAAASAKVAIVRLTGLPALVVVQTGGREGIARLRAAGAWLVVNPVAVASCSRDELGSLE